MNLTAVFVQDGPWIVAWITEIPGVQTQGATMEEARENLMDALRLMLEDLRDQETSLLAGKTLISREAVPMVA